MNLPAVNLSERASTGSYSLLLEQARALLADESDPVANAANLSALLFHQLDDINWAGFYFFDGQELVVGPFQGQPACVRIAMGAGVCGTAARSRQVQRVADVDEFEGHIPCDSASRSEIVIPLLQRDRLLGVLDLDSPRLNRFAAEDEQGLVEIAQVYVDSLVAAG